jgi:hypothetical protein
VGHEKKTVTRAFTNTSQRKALCIHTPEQDVLTFLNYDFRAPSLLNFKSHWKLDPLTPLKGLY